MSVRVERSDRIMVILSRPEARNAVNPEHADALYKPFWTSTPTRAPRRPSSGAKAEHSALVRT